MAELVFRHNEDCKCGGQEVERISGPITGATEKLEFQIKMETWCDGAWCVETPYLRRGEVVTVPWHRITAVL